MKPQFALSLAGLLMTFAPGCCVFEAIFGCHHWRDGGPAYAQCDDGCGHHKKCAKKCRKCRECLEEHGYGGMYGDMGFGGDCGCGGGMMGDIYGGDMMAGGGGCGCSQGGGAPMMSTTPFMTTPPMNVPTPGPTPTPASPPQTSGTMLPPPIPPIDTSSNMQIPPSVQQVSVEEFQRLPGTVVSGPGSPMTSATAPQATGQLTTTLSPILPAPPASPQPVQTNVVSSVPTNARQVQQTGWAPVRK